MTSKHKLLAAAALLAVGLIPDQAIAQQDRPLQESRDPRRGRAIAKADVDQNGALSHAEFVAAHEKRFFRIDANRDGKIDRGEFIRTRDKTERKIQNRETAFKNADANQDGVVTKEEWMALADKRFAARDRNADGRLAKDDRGAKRAQRPARTRPPEAPVRME
jgi:Ca2+-binding EF-hand superfamily protein